MTRSSVLLVVLGLAAAGCGSKTQPTPANTTTTGKFTAQLLPSKVNPPVTGGESFGSGDLTLTVNVTKNAAGTAIASTADFVVTISGFGFDSLYVTAHVHRGNAACLTATPACPVVIDTAAFPSPGFLFPAGAGKLVDKPGVAVTPADLANELLSSPDGFYFDIHTASNNPNGVARGQLVRTQ